MPLVQNEPAGSPGQFVGQSLTNGRPVLTGGFSGEHPPGTGLKFLGPKVPNCGGVVRGGRVQAGQQFGGHIGAFFFRQSEHFS